MQNLVDTYVEKHSLYRPCVIFLCAPVGFVKGIPKNFFNLEFFFQKFPDFFSRTENVFIYSLNFTDLKLSLVEKNLEIEETLVQNLLNA